MSLRDHPIEARDIGTLSPRLIGFLAFMAGATVANLYYSQPLLAQIARSFHLSPSGAGMVVVVTQIGYALGLILIVPLGDGHERKRLITYTTAMIAVTLTAVATAPSFTALLLACLCMGIATTVPQLIVPYTATLAAPARRGRAIGLVMSGLLVGIILSRSLSGFGAFLGWRVIFGSAAVAMAILAAASAALLPKQMPAQHIAYKTLIPSLYHLWRKEPILRLHAFLGAMGFAAFSCFWTALIFHFAHLFPGHASRMVGIMGLFGAAGALAAPLSGHLSDRLSARAVNGTALVLVGVSFLVLWQAHASLALIALGVVLLDAGVQGSHISNQTRIYALAPDKRNRLTALYMTTYFVGGAAGSFVGSLAWQEGRWQAVCASGACFASAALVRLKFGINDTHSAPPCKN
ncbi:MAG: MFS transporter [Acidiferrobacter sp.]